jgi:4-hydroxy-2-oxoheptanedioate aldolase
MSAWPLDGPPALGVWVKLPVPEVLEVLAASGVDFVVLDGEHGIIDRRTMSALVGLARALGLRVFVRVSGSTPSELQPALDDGVDGVFVPHIDDVATALRVVDACRFPPIGSRAGSLATRAGRWGRSGLREYIDRGNDSVTIVAQIESPGAVASIAGIAAVSGLDAVFIGPFDLALSSGEPPTGAPFQAMLERVEAGASGIALGGVAADAAEAAAMCGRGYGFLMIGADTTILSGAAGSLVERLRESTTREPQRQEEPPR